jgi:hypothetical protein
VPATAQATLTGTGDPRAGVVNAFTWGHPTFDRYTNAPGTYGAFLTHTLWGLSTLRPYFDTKLRPRARRAGLIVLDGTGRADPVNTAAPSLSVAVGQQVTGSTGAWRGHPWRFGYQWSRCDASGAGCSAISGATAATYTTQRADAGGTVKVTVTASNSQGGTAATSTQTVAVSP